MKQSSATLCIIVAFLLLITACAPIQDLPKEPPAPGSQKLYGRAITDVGSLPSWASAIKYTTVNKDILQTGEKLTITVQKPAFYQGSQAQFIIYDKAYFYNTQSQTWTAVNFASNSGAAAVSGYPWRLDKSVFELTMDSRFADGKNFFLVYYCGRATQTGNWDCEGNKWKIGTFEYRPLRVNCGNNFLDPDEECEEDSDCSSGEVCTSTCMCRTPEEQRAELLHAQMTQNGKKIDILLPSIIEASIEADVFIGINNTETNNQGTEICFRTQIKCLSAGTGQYCDPANQRNNILVGGYDFTANSEVQNPWFTDIAELDTPETDLTVFLGEAELPTNLASGTYTMRLTAFKNKDNKQCGTTFGTAAQTEYAYTDFNMIAQGAPFCGDGTISSSEQCDGNTIAHGTCTNCQIQCDAGYIKNNNNQCVQSTGPACGNGIKEGTEECDGTDGRPANGACNNQCQITCNSGYSRQGNSCVQTTGYKWSNLVTLQCGSLPCGYTACAQGVTLGSPCTQQQLNTYCMLTGPDRRLTCERDLTSSTCNNGVKEGNEECDGTQGVPQNGACNSQCQITCNTGYIKQGNQCVLASAANQWIIQGSCVPIGGSPSCPPQRTDCQGMTSGTVCEQDEINTYCVDSSLWSGMGSSIPLFQCLATTGSGPTAQACGNGIKEGTEQCDGTQGVPQNGACNSQCQITCNNGYAKTAQNTCAPEGIWVLTNNCIPDPGDGIFCGPTTNTCTYPCTIGTYCHDESDNEYECRLTAPVQNLKWIPEGICSDQTCTGSMCAATCPTTAQIAQNSLGTACQTKGASAKVSSSQGDTFVLAKCGEVSQVTAHTWQVHAECSLSCSSPGCILCPTQACSGKQPDDPCTSNDLDDLCYLQSGSFRDILACKPTSGVQFLEASFPLKTIPQITGAVSFEDITNSRSTQIAIVLIASLGIFVITLLNIIHKEN